MHMAEAYEDLIATLKQHKYGSPIRERNDLILDCMRDACEQIAADDERGLEFPDGSVYLTDHDCSFETFDEAKDYVAQWRHESESDARDLNATADYMLGRTGL